MEQKKYTIEEIEKTAGKLKDQLVDIAYQLIANHDAGGAITDDEIKAQRKLLADQKFLKVQYKSLVDLLRDMKKLNPKGSGDIMAEILEKITSWDLGVAPIQKKIN